MAGSDMTAAGMYLGNIGRMQPTGVPEPLHQGAPEPTIATAAPGKAAGNPIMLLVLMIGVVILLTQVSFRGTINVSG